MFWFVFCASRPSRLNAQHLTFSCDSAWTILCKDGPDIRRERFETHKKRGGNRTLVEKRRSTWNFRENFITMTQGKMEMVVELIVEMIFLDSCKLVQLWEVTSFHDHFFKILYWSLTVKWRLKKHQIPISDHCCLWFRVDMAILCSFASLIATSTSLPQPKSAWPKGKDPYMAPKILYLSCIGLKMMAFHLE